MRLRSQMKFAQMGSGRSPPLLSRLQTATKNACGHHSHAFNPLISTKNNPEPTQTKQRGA